jgi:hypothetical protein
VYGPHRLRMSGVAPQGLVPSSQVIPTVPVGESEIVSMAVEIQVEIIQLGKPK